jgi:hypothetical protein
MRFINRTGQRYGRLLVLSVADRKSRKIRWLCRCDCGRETVVFQDSLSSGNTRSCGCLHIDTITDHGASPRGRISAQFRRWQNMIARCHNPDHPSYERYGARGISVCDRWLNSFSNFNADMGPCPQGASIDRIDNNAGYSHENCRWSNRVQQAQNTRLNNNLTFQGETHCLSEWARLIGVPYSRLRKRIESGWSVERAMSHGRMKSKHG